MASETLETGKTKDKFVPKILVLASAGCAYPGIDNVGQQHLHYPVNSFVIEIPSPVIFPEKFYFDAFKKGIDGIIVMGCGEECPYKGAFPKLSMRINIIGRKLNKMGIKPQRIRLTAICTVCAKHVVKHISEMNDFLLGLGPFPIEKLILEEENQ